MTQLCITAFTRNQLVEIAYIANRQGVYPFCNEDTAAFVVRLLRDLDRHPVLQQDIYVYLATDPPPAAAASETTLPRSSTANAAMWAVRIGLAAFGIYTVF